MAYGQEYDVVLKVRDHSVTAYVNGALVNRLTMPSEARGRVALRISIWKYSLRGLSPGLDLRGVTRLYSVIRIER